jgi:hypothetical protein
MVRVRGWMAVVIGAFLVIMMAWLAMWMSNQSAHGNILCDAAEKGLFLARVYTAFALIAACGLMSAASGIVLVRTGRTNWRVAVAMVVLFLAACYFGASGAAACGST